MALRSKNQMAELIQEITICKNCNHGETFHLYRAVEEADGIRNVGTVCCIDNCKCIKNDFTKQIQICVPKMGYIHKITRLDAEDIWEFELDKKASNTVTVHREFDVIKFFRPNGGPDFRPGDTILTYKILGIVRNTPIKDGETATLFLMRSKTYSTPKARIIDKRILNPHVCDLLNKNLSIPILRV